MHPYPRQRQREHSRPDSKYPVGGFRTKHYRILILHLISEQVNNIFLRVAPIFSLQHHYPGTRLPCTSFPSPVISGNEPSPPPHATGPSSTELSFIKLARPVQSRQIGPTIFETSPPEAAQAFAMPR
ncbi:hypothetical protein P152DRAFT_158550 [Eremomyces bilateralis CBS 781.70]|uniref:Uncharacterized protein n=1 Tax=Eremomyces bilateralis CBS 781.70 TaxID=1392243 RepID=A0A6G1FV00_9PEZI|nr:uncharacterized protein P152DRAFT_158550 [Eremomyces bilateralis CBS 781.70]KAF1809481.1 hypothetical protein P152DRAFT_158550 [Eremomyces bilateralis CBS 781.70]